MAKKKKATVKKVLKPIAKYMDTEILIPNFNKIVKRGDLVPEMPIEEARARRDFTIVNEKEN